MQTAKNVNGFKQHSQHALQNLGLTEMSENFQFALTCIANTALFVLLKLVVNCIALKKKTLSIINQFD